MSPSNGLLPSESRRVRSLLYLGEGLIVGGFLAAISIPFLPSTIRFLGSGHLSVSTSFVAIVVLFAIATLFKLSVLTWGRRHSPERDRSLPERDWSETRRWRWVIGIALSAYLAVLGTSIVLLRVERIGTFHVGVLTGLLPVFAGLFLLVYTWRRLGVVR